MRWDKEIRLQTYLLRHFSDIVAKNWLLISQHDEVKMHFYTYYLLERMLQSLGNISPGATEYQGSAA